jgi:hypothetical protein
MSGLITIKQPGQSHPESMGCPGTQSAYIQASQGSVHKSFRLLISFILMFLSIYGKLQAQNPIVTENLLTGNPKSEWDISGAGDLSIQGFATQISINKGTTVRFKINVDGAVNYRIRIYRLGYYNGLGARLINDLGIFTGIDQPSPLSNNSTGLVDCGNWTESASWPVPASAVSGLYIARLSRSDNNGSSHIAFVVRDDERIASVLFKTSDATWQAYNVYGGNSLYTGSTPVYPAGHAVKVSYNRPFITRNGGGGGGAMEDWLFNAEYPMIRWMERNGYDVSYTTDVDMSRDATPITPAKHKVLLSVGHDEYWSGPARTRFENARNAGVHLGFFSGNEVYWKTRWENSIDGSGTPYRTLVCYKEGTLGENVCGGKCDPMANTWTGLWRDGCDFPNADGCKPENALSGQISWVDATGAIRVTSTYKSLPFWRNTSVATLAAGQAVTFTNGTLGYEWDGRESAYANSYPANRQILSSTSLAGAVHELSLYTHSSGALVFGAGTVQWSWGLDNIHDRGSAAASRDMQQATANLFYDMGVPAGSLQSDLVPGNPTPDTTPPIVTANAPATGASGISTTTTITATLNENLDPSTVTTSSFEVRDPGNILIAGSVAYNSASRIATFSPTTALSNSTTYTVVLKGGSLDPRIKDAAGNALAANFAWSFTTVAATPLAVTANTPASGATAVSITASVSATFNQAIDAATLTNTTFELRNASNTLIPGTISYNSSTLTATLTPSASLANSAVYTATLRGGSTDPRIKTAAGNALASNHTWNFTTAAASSGTTYSIFSPTSVPATTDSETKAIEVGVKFRTSVNGFITGIRYYKSTNNTGAHVGTLWSRTGTMLARATFIGETASGWQQVIFSSPVAVTAGTTYVASYHTNTGRYSINTNYFTANTGLTTFVQALQNGLDGVNGVYRYSANSIFPNSGFRSSNYWVDVVFSTGTTSDQTPPTVTANSPLNGTSAVSTASTVTATFNEAIDPATLNSTTFEVRDAVNTLVSGNISYNAANRTVSFTPAASLANSTAYTATLKGGTTDPRVKDAAGNALATNHVWSFTTEAATPLTVTSTSPANGATGIATTTTVTATFNQAIDQTTLNSSTFELRDAASNVISGIVTYNATTRTATLTPSAALTNSTVYTAIVRGGAADPRVKTASGVTLASDQTWSFTTVASTPLTLTAKTPTLGATGIAINTTVTATFSQAIDQTTLNSSTFELRDAGSILVPATISYNTTTRVATLIPSAALANSTVYTATMKGGSTDPRVKTAGGVALTANHIWSFTTAPAGPTGTTIWSSTTTPSLITEPDPSAVELGVKFRASVNGFITGIRFYKGGSNTGIHTANLWLRTGTNLARATFIGETASGWQEVLFNTPVAITAGTTYVGSYHTTQGNYSVDENYFTTTITSGPLQALANGVDGGNGIYRYSATTIFPNSSFASSNYWVDVIFTTNSSFSAMQSALASADIAYDPSTGLAVQRSSSVPSLQVDKNIMLTSYPNPLSETATVEFTVPTDEKNVLLSLYSVTGLKALSLYQGPAKANQPYRFQLNGQNLAPGIYFIHLVSPFKTANRKILISGN